MEDIYSLDDLILPPDQIKEAKIYRRAKVKADHEIELPKEEREILHREIVQFPEFKKMAKQIVDVYFSDNRDYLSQNYYLEEYRNNRFRLPWLVPIVQDTKIVYKKKNVGPNTLFQENADLLRSINEFINYANFDQPQALLEALHNYIPKIGEESNQKGIRVRNHLGLQVIRINNEDLNDPKSLEFRGSYGTSQGISLVERQKTANRNIIVGYDTYDQVIGEQLEVIGFAEFPLDFPSLRHENWFPLAKISLAESADGFDKILQNALPPVESVLAKENLTGITDIRLILSFLEKYGHPVQSLTESNRKSITEMISTNLSIFKPDTYTRTTRLEYPMLEKELIGEKGSGILEMNIIEDSAIKAYGINFAKFPRLFYQYLKIVRQLDNGLIWMTLINPNSTKKQISNAVQSFRILREFNIKTRDLKSSYFNLINKTMPNQELYEDLTDNPLDSIQEINQEKRDLIAWTLYFKKSYLSKDGTSYYWHGKRIGCVHEYDRLYKMFEDPDDSYPYGKKWTVITPFGGVICGFCGDTIIEDDEIVSQGYDSRGQRINTYDNEGLFKQPDNIELYFQEKTEVVKTGEKMVDLWVTLSQQRENDRIIKGLKYKLIRSFEEIIQKGDFKSGLQQNPNKMMKTSNRGMGEFLIKKYAIIDPGNFPTGWFLKEKIFPFFYSLSGVYDILINRLAIFLVILNWHLVHEDPIYLNPNILLRMFTHEQVGKYFMIYQLNQRTAFQSLSNSKKDSIQDNFIEVARKVVPQKKLSPVEYQTKLDELYLESKRKYLWVQNNQGLIFNGDNPLEHEIVVIMSEYLKGMDRPDVMVNLENLFNSYWKTWKSRFSTEVRKLEENSRINILGKENLLHKVDSGERPLYDRFLSQHRMYKLQQLEQVYLDLVNDQIHQIQISSTTRSKQSGKQVGGHSFCPPSRNSVYSETLMKKMIVLNRLNCEDWSNIEELDIIGIESETQRLNAIMTLKTDIAGLERQIGSANTMNRPYVPDTSGDLKGYPQRSRKYDVYRILFKPPTFKFVSKSDSKGKFAQMIWAKNYQVPEKLIVKDKPVANFDKLIERLSFLVGQNLRSGETIKNLGDLTQIFQKLGSITWYSESEKFSRHHNLISSGMMAGTSHCNQSEEPTSQEKEQFDEQFAIWNQDMYIPSKARLINLKKYILTYVRQRIYILETIKSREALVKYGLERYLSLFDYDTFNEAFMNFNGGKGVDKTTIDPDEYGNIYSNDEIDELVEFGLKDDTDESYRMKTIDLLTRILLSDLVRQLDQVRTKAGRFQGKSKVISSKMDAGMIFEGFLRILIGEIWEIEKVGDVDFHHRDINEQIRGKMIFDKFDKAEKKSPLDYTIARFQIQAEEEFDEIINDTGGYMIGDEKKADKWDDGEVDVENDEDDYDEPEPYL